MTDLCYITQFSSDKTLSPKCVESIFKNKPFEKINQVCYFQCIKRNDETIIKQIGIHTFAITNPQPTLKIRSGKKGNFTEKILQINYDNPGLIKISLPCNHELLKNNETIIPRMYPCENSNTNKLSIKRVLPISWTNINSIQINNLDYKENVFFTNITDILNNN